MDAKTVKIMTTNTEFVSEYITSTGPSSTTGSPFNDSWSLTRVGHMIWAAACLIALLFMVIFRGRPSNGFCLTYSYFLVAHVATSTISLVRDAISEDAITTTKNTVMVLEWWNDILTILAAGVLIRLFVLLAVRRNEGILIKLSWALTAVVWGAATTLQKLESNKEYFDKYLTKAFYLFGFALFWIAVLREWCRALCCTTKSAEDLDLPKGCLAGYSKRLFTCLGSVAVLVGLIDYVFAAVAEITLLERNLLDIEIWEYNFLSRLLDSVIFTPFMVVFLIWADCSANIKMKKKFDDIGPFDGLESTNGIGVQNIAFDST